MKTTYSEKLRDPRWQKKRLEVLDRDSFTCQDCGSTSTTLHVHHFWYERGLEPWDYPMDCYVTLCENCHSYESSTRPSIDSLLLDTFRKKGMTTHDLVEIIMFINAVRLPAVLRDRNEFIANLFNQIWFGSQKSEGTESSNA